MADQPVIIIRKKKKGGHAAHHGGAWKVAYADFVTAMMSFFLLLWLLNVTTSEQRRGLADYFSPAGISRNESSGAGGMFGGRSITTVSGAEMADRSPPSMQQATIPTVGQGEEGSEDVAGLGQGEEDSARERQAEEASAMAALTEEAKKLLSDMEKEEVGFKTAERLLKEAILSSPELRAFSDQILIDRTSEGLRIQITDKENLSLFPSASAIPYRRGRDLLLMIGKVIAQLPNKISVAGHTDSAPFVVGSRRDNWTLSTERANTCREYLVKAGVDEKKITRVSGLADREPFTTDPRDPRNRRISIVLLRQAKTAVNEGKATP
ncbi:MAG: flagellar motor protein MotB [Alphaproteobacteria bacterium]|nr:flagellar motor protein MotB [Alphaproteobacteria bacterium]